VNWGLALGSIALVLGLRESSALAAAYGVAVTGTMLITSIAFAAVVRTRWEWSWAATLGTLGLMLAIDVPFLVANLAKFFHGGFIPVVIATVLLTTMLVWWKGHALLTQYRRRSPGLPVFLAQLELRVAARVPGTAVFLTELESVASSCLLHHVARINSLHETVVMLTIRTMPVPSVERARRWELGPEGKGFWRLLVRYGYMEQPDVAAVIRELVETKQLEFDPAEVTYYLGRSTFLATERGRMGRIAEAAFAFLERNAYTADRYFGIPPAQVVELGNRLDL
jgi:KUP system potassium uptake protein